MAIKRYRFTEDDELNYRDNEVEDGEWARFEDHEKAVAEATGDLRRKLDRAVGTLSRISVHANMTVKVWADNALREIESTEPQEIGALVEESARAIPEEIAAKFSPETQGGSGGDELDSLRIGAWPAEMGQAIVDNRRAIARLQREKQDKEEDDGK